MRKTLLMTSLPMLMVLPLMAAASATADVSRSAGRTLPTLRTAPAPFEASVLNRPQIRKSPAAHPLAETTSTVFSMHPTEAEFAQCKIVDANGDGNSFSYHVVQTDTKLFDWPIYYEIGSSVKDADEWLIFPAVELNDAAHMYVIEADARAGATFSFESFEMRLGTSPDPDAMTIVAMDEPAVGNTDYERYSSNFAIPAPGTYYVGLHLTTKTRSGSRFMMRDVRLSTTATDASLLVVAPEVLSAYSSTSASGNTARVEFRYPETTYFGEKIPASGEVSVEIATDTHTATFTGHPGATYTAEVACNDVRGVVTLTSIREGVRGLAVRTRLVPDHDTPLPPTVGCKVSDDNLTMTLSWAHVTEGVNGGKVDQESLRYNVYQYTTQTDGENQWAGWLPLATGLRNPEYSYSVPAGTLQTVVDLIVTTSTAQGESEGDAGSAASAVLGELYSLPLEENYVDGVVKYAGYAPQYPSALYEEAQWGFVNIARLFEEAGSVNVLASITNSSDPAMTRINFPKVSLKGAHDLEFSFHVYLNETTAPTEVSIVGSNGSQAVIGRFDPVEETRWATLRFNIPAEFNNLPWAYIMLDGMLFSPMAHICISEYALAPLAANDMRVVSLAGVSARIGEPFAIEAVVENNGYATSKAPALKAVVTGGPTRLDLALATDASELARGDKAVYRGTMTINKADFLNRTLRLEVALAQADDNNSNNSQSVEFKLLPVAGPIVDDLSGKQADDGSVTLTWSNPITDFSVESFEYLMHGEYSADLNGWMNIDFDRKDVWAVEGVAFPYDVLPKAFQVINGTQLGEASFPAYDGDQYLVAFCPQDETATADDWLISPEIDPAGGFGFALNIISGAFTERLDVLASTTDREPDSFSLITTIEKSDEGWKPYSVDVPADARYVALNYRSRDQFGVMLDRFEYQPAEDNYALVGFNVYRNGVKVNAAPIAQPTYTDNAPDAANADYNVTVVATHNGAELESPMSNTVNIARLAVDDSFAAAGTIEARQGEVALAGFARPTAVEVYTTSGVLVGKVVAGMTTTAVKLPAGVYIVKAGTAVSKVAVR